MRWSLTLGAVPLALGLAAGQGDAQSIHITPLAGAFHPSSNFYDVRDAAQAGQLVMDNALALGVNVEFLMLRASAMYATGATITEEGITGKIGDGSMLKLTGDLMLRPIPRIAGFQPYALGGIGVKHDSYSFDVSGFDGIEDNTDFGLNIGIGADLMLGRMGVALEVSDFISTTGDDTLGRHDAFVMLGLRLRAF